MVPDAEGADALIDRASRGEASAVEGLLARYHADLEFFLSRRAGGEILQKESTGDLVQSVCREVLERVRDGRFRFHGEAAFRKWLYQAALLKLRNRHDYYRAEKRDARGVQAVPSGSQIDVKALWAGELPSPSRAADLHEQIDELIAALDQLTEAQRRIIEFARFEGLTHAELAARLGISEAASRQQLARALVRLTTVREQMRGAGGGGQR